MHADFEIDENIQKLVNAVYERPNIDMDENWLSFMEMSDILLQNINACHVGNLDEYLFSARAMLPGMREASAWSSFSTCQPCWYGTYLETGIPNIWLFDIKTCSGTDYLWRDYLGRVCSMVYSKYNKRNNHYSHQQ